MDEQKTPAKTGIVICDACAEQLDLKALIYTRVIEKDESGRDVAEKCFDCPKCGKHYSVTIYNHELLRLMNERRRIRRMIELMKTHGCREQAIERKIRENERIKKKQLDIQSALLKKYYGGNEDA